MGRRLTESERALLDRMIEQDWSVDDLIEARLDETSVATSVGSGPDVALGSKPFEDDKLEKIFGEFEEYLKKSTMDDMKRLAAKRFSERRGLPESWAKKLLEQVKKRC